jgi:hypothetical protein
MATRSLPDCHARSGGSAHPSFFLPSLCSPVRAAAGRSNGIWRAMIPGDEESRPDAEGGRLPRAKKFSTHSTFAFSVLWARYSLSTSINSLIQLPQPVILKTAAGGGIMVRRLRTLRHSCLRRFLFGFLLGLRSSSLSWASCVSAMLFTRTQSIHSSQLRLTK